MNSFALEELLSTSLSLCSYADNNGVGISRFAENSNDSKEALVYELADMLFFIAGDKIGSNKTAIDMINTVLSYNNLHLSAMEAGRIASERRDVSATDSVAIKIALLCDSLNGYMPWLFYNNTKTTGADILTELFTAYGNAMSLIINDYHSKWRFNKYISTYLEFKKALEKVLFDTDDDDDSGENEELEFEEFEDENEDYEDDEGEEYEDDSLPEEVRIHMNNCLSILRKNTDIVNTTFERLGLQVLQQSWQLEGEEGFLNCFVEFAGNIDLPSEDYFTLKANIYDADGVIIYSETSTIKKANYLGYETKKIQFYDEGAVLKARKARIFVVPGWHVT